MGVRVRVKGRVMLKRRTARAVRLINAGIEDAVAESVEAIEGDAKDNAPDDPTTVGLLKEGIEGHTDGTSGTVGVFGPAAEYAKYPELGTSEQEAQHFMLAAAEAEHPRLERRVRAHVNAKLGRL